VSAIEASPVTWLCIDASAITDIDYTGAETIKQACGELHDHGVRLVFVNVMHNVRQELDRYGITELVGTDAFYGAVGDVLDAFNDRQTPS
jgi:MFS superfamily sulfate permease-like transporter